MKDFLIFLTTRLFFKHLLIVVGASLFLLFGSLIWLNLYTRHNQALTVPDLTGLNPDEADMIIQSRKLRLSVIDSVYYKDFPRGSIVKQNPEAGSRVKEFRTIYITLNAVNPERIMMPAVAGVSLRQARAILETYGLNLGKISYKPDIAINNVLQQTFLGNSIQPGEMIIKGSSIDLVLGKGLSDETTIVPNLIGMDINRAKENLADKYLNIGATVFDNTIITAEDSLFAFIWRQQPGFEEGERLQLGSNVDIWLTVDSLKIATSDSLKLELMNSNESKKF